MRRRPQKEDFYANKSTFSCNKSIDASGESQITAKQHGANSHKITHSEQPKDNKLQMDSKNRSQMDQKNKLRKQKMPTEELKSTPKQSTNTSPEAP